MHWIRLAVIIWAVLCGSPHVGKGSHRGAQGILHPSKLLDQGQGLKTSTSMGHRTGTECPQMPPSEVGARGGRVGKGGMVRARC